MLNKVLMSWRLPFAALIAAGLGAFAAPTDLRAADSPGGEASLTPHRAVYVLKLNKTREGGTITSAEGAMSIQMEKTCDGWVFGQSM
ncbi:MAG: EipB family protein, partial [Rhodospirillales bacterium]